mgnify:FL=1
MQKIVNVIAVSSGVVSLAVVIGGLSLYVNRDGIIDNIKSQAIESIIGGSGLPGGFGGAGLGGDLPVGTPDLASPAPQAAAPDFRGENAAAGGPVQF